MLLCEDNWQFKKRCTFCGELNALWDLGSFYAMEFSLRTSYVVYVLCVAEGGKKDPEMYTAVLPTPVSLLLLGCKKIISTCWFPS